MVQLLRGVHFIGLVLFELMGVMLTKLASQYFSFLAERFPVMCASDEFHFLPRAGDADRYIDRLDDLDSRKVKEVIDELKLLRERCESMRFREGVGFDEEVDLDLLAASISGFLVEFEIKECCRSNPLLYLKIAFIGLDHALGKPSASPEEVVYRTGKRLEAIPRLLRQGMDNLESIPDSLLRPAIAMSADCLVYLQGCQEKLASVTDRAALPSGSLEKAAEALESFRSFLNSFEPLPDSQYSSDTLDVSLRHHFQSARTLDEIFEIAVEDWNWIWGKLEKTGKEIDASIPWQELYERISPPGEEGAGILSRYRREAERVNQFFSGNDLIDISSCSNLVIEETPRYLRSVRGSASFAASLNPEDREADRFYITTSRNEGGEAGSMKRYAARLHREYRFLSAHETIPGHFLLDSVRRNLANPVRRQIESPLFYEGWASYAETLLAEHHYVMEPEDLLIDFRRRLWRAARCQIDVGTATGRLTREGAVKLLEKVGFTREEAAGQVDRFRLNPGYQLCYCLGSYEIRKLAEKYMPAVGDREFYACLLEGGEIPFHLIEPGLEKNNQLQKGNGV